MKTFQDRVAAITGAASGIGRALAQDLASRGAHLAISDVDEVGLAETKRRCIEQGARVHTRVVDVSQKDEIEAWCREVVGEFGRVHMVFNNAGIAAHGTTEEIPDEIYERVLSINFWGVVHGTRAFLPHLKRANEGHVINISSLFGLISVAGQGPYNAAKFAVRGFTECLKQEMDLTAPTVKVTCVHPGGIKTNIARSSHFTGQGLGPTSHEKMANRFDNVLARTSAEDAAAIILDAVLRDEPRVLVGPDAKVIDLVQRLMPRRYHGLVTRLIARTFAL